jgi:hypothetical protein
MRVERAFNDLVAYERPRRILELLKEIETVVLSDASGYLAAQPIRFTSEHPMWRTAQHFAEVLTGHDADDICCVDLLPSERGEGRLDVIVFTVDRRRHEKVAVDVDRVAGAWLDARQE